LLDDLRETFDDLAGELLILPLELALRLFELALQVEALLLEVGRQLAALVVAHDDGLALELLLQPVELLLLALELALELVDARLEVDLRLLAGVRLVQGTLQVDDADLGLGGLHGDRHRQEREQQRSADQVNWLHELLLLFPAVSHARRHRTSHSGAPNENRMELFFSSSLMFSGMPYSMRSGPNGDSHRMPAPMAYRRSPKSIPCASRNALPMSKKTTPLTPTDWRMGKMISFCSTNSLVPPIGLLLMTFPCGSKLSWRGPSVRVS